MDRALVDRRRHARFDASLLAHLRATLRPGNTIALVNLAAGGTLVHSTRPLRPGARIHLHLTGGTHVVLAAGQVLRCGVARLSADGVVYVGALNFDSHCNLPWAEPGRQNRVENR